MSVASLGLFLQKSAKDAILTYNDITLAKPIIIQASGITDILRLTGNGTSKCVKYDVTADGATVVSILPAKVEGELVLQATSPAYAALAKRMTAQYMASLAVPATLTVYSPSGLWTINYTNLILMGAPAGFELADEVKEVVIPFSAAIPSSINLGALASAVTGLANLV